MIVNSSNSNSSPTKSLELNSGAEPTSKTLDPQFINFCHQQLAYFIGPMASLIIEETLGYNNSYSPESFVETLAQQIPSVELRVKFKQRLM